MPAIFATQVANYDPTTFTTQIHTCHGTFSMFIVMSNELNTPRTLNCPADGFDVGATLGHTAATTWAGTVPLIFGPSVSVAYVNYLNVSYFVGVDAQESSSGLKAKSRMFLTGDRTMGFCTVVTSRRPHRHSLRMRVGSGPYRVGGLRHMPSRLRPWQRCYMQPIHCGSHCWMVG